MKTRRFRVKSFIEDSTGVVWKIQIWDWYFPFWRTLGRLINPELFLDISYPTLEEAITAAHELLDKQDKKDTFKSITVELQP